VELYLFSPCIRPWFRQGHIYHFLKELIDYGTFSNVTMRGPGSVVGIATGYRLDDPGIDSRWGARFFAPVQTGPGAHPASCTMGTGSFPVGKSGRGVTLAPHP
jgi:hypothetical protein